MPLDITPPNPVQRSFLVAANVYLISALFPNISKWLPSIVKTITSWSPTAPAL
jgi:hypothetical protein